MLKSSEITFNSNDI